MNVLVLSAGRRVELVQAFQRELRNLIPGAKVVAADARPELSSACHIADARVTLPRCGEAEYVDALRDTCIRHAIGLVIPTIDHELPILAQHRSDFANAGVHVMISDPALVADARDKRRVAQLFQRLGMATPKILDRSSPTFPCFVKPYDGSAGIGARRVDTAAEISADMLADEKLMFMEYLGRNYAEYTIDCYYDRQGHLRCLVPRERLEVRAGEVSKGITRRHDLYDDLLQCLDRLTGARGCITVQVFYDVSTKRTVGIEINARFGGGYPLADAAGATFPRWSLQEYLLGDAVPFFDRWESDLLMLRYDAKVLVHAASSHHR